MKKYLLLAIMSIPVGLNAQTEKKSKVTYHPSFQAGILAGASGGSGQMQLVNSLEYKKFSFGAGVGIDYYHQRSVPVFADLRRELNIKGYTPYIYVQAGHDFVWLKDMEGETFESDHKSGLYYDIGIGYKMPLHKKLQMTFSAGYNHKEMSKTVNSMPWISVWPAPSNSFQQYEFEFRRISVKAGLSF